MQSHRHPIPLLTLLLLGLTFAIQLSPETSEMLRYNRADFFAGDWWRPATAWLSHYSVSHLGWNWLVLAVAGLFVETKQRRTVFLLALCCIPLHYLLPLAANIEQYAGLSGFSVAMVTVLACDRLQTVGSDRRLWGGVIILLIGKVIIELISSQTLLARGDFAPLPAAHLTGIATALLIFRMTAQKKSPAETAGLFPNSSFKKLLRFSAR